MQNGIKISFHVLLQIIVDDDLDRFYSYLLHSADRMQLSQNGSAFVIQNLAKNSKQNGYTK